MLNSAYAGAGRMDSSLYFPLPSINRLNQTEPATFAILLFWALFRGANFLYLPDIETNDRANGHFLS